MLKQITLSVAAIACTALALSGQIITNGSFENWDSTALYSPDDWVNSNFYNYNDGGSTGISKVAGKNGFAIKLETVSATNYANAAGIMNGNFIWWDGVGGLPYSQQPNAIEGYYMCDLQPDDSAIIMVFFKKAGVVISEDWFKIGGQQNSFTKFSFPLSLSAQPDSMVFFASSSDIDLGNEAIGSYIILDELRFAGTNITQQMTNADFENWFYAPYKTLANWEREATGVAKTTDAYTGNYATELTTVNYLDDVYVGGIYYGNRESYFFVSGGIPYTQDTLVFYYKYMPVNNDSAYIEMEYSMLGNSIYRSDVYLHAASTYTRAEIPFKSVGTPDTVRWSLFSSATDNDEIFVGSRLIVDDFHLKSEETSTRVSIPAKQTARVYPNPATESINIIPAAILPNARITLLDVLGKTVDSITIPHLFDGAAIPVAHLEAGIYMYQITSSGMVVASGKFSKQ